MTSQASPWHQGSRVATSNVSAAPAAGDAHTLHSKHLHSSQCVCVSTFSHNKQKLQFFLKG